MANVTKQKVPTIQAPKGMHDILPGDQELWAKVRKTAKDIADYYNFLRIDTPLLERSDLFERSIGFQTDIVEKQMFTIKTKGKEELVLRPEATAPVARAFIEHSLGQTLGLPLKLYYEGAMFRYEQPQAGRYRQFHQLGFEIISGDDDPILDAQIILVFFRFLEGLKIKDVTVGINSIGCKNCRPGYRRELQAFYRGRRGELCEDCKRRLDTNPLRLLDCKVPGCQPVKENAPIAVDHLCNACRSHFRTLLEYVEELGLPYRLDHRLVRGLDYYTKTVFEISGDGGIALGGGGRYDYLIELLGGKNSPAVGWAAGLDRIVEFMKAKGIAAASRLKPKPSLIYIGELAKKKSLKLVEELRRAGLEITEMLGRESLNAQLRNADKIHSPYALILGQKEVFEESIIVRDMKSGVQETVPLAKLVEVIKKRLK